MLMNNLFRKTAIDKISSPDDLDKNVQVVSIHGWIALISAIVLILIVIVWSYVGNISTFIEGSGIVMYGSGIENITATQDGIITDLNIEVGENVDKNTTIARINQSDIVTQINLYKDYCSQLNDFKSTKFNDLDSISYDVYLMLKDDIIQYQSISDDSQKSILYNQLLTTCNMLLDDYEKKISNLQQDLINKSSIDVSSNGKVLEVYKKTGDYVQVSDVIASIIIQNIDADSQTQSLNNEVILYIPIDDGKKITKGMSVQISPSTVDKEKYGCIVGTVKSVSEYAVSEESMLDVLNNQLLVENISTGDALIEVHIELLKDSSTVSQYKWTTKNGAPITIAPGTVCSGRIAIDDNKPIEIVFPFLKSIFDNFGGVSD